MSGPADTRHRPFGLPEPHGLYDPRREHDACGVGLIANINNIKSHKIITDGLSILRNLEHRGAVGADPKAGDGAGVLLQIPHAFFSPPRRQRLGFVAARAQRLWRRLILFMPREPIYRRGHRAASGGKPRARKVCKDPGLARCAGR